MPKQPSLFQRRAGLRGVCSAITLVVLLLGQSCARKPGEYHVYTGEKFKIVTRVVSPGTYTAETAERITASFEQSECRTFSVAQLTIGPQQRAVRIVDPQGTASKPVSSSEVVSAARVVCLAGVSERVFYDGRHVRRQIKRLEGHASTGQMIPGWRVLGFSSLAVPDDPGLHEAWRLEWLLVYVHAEVSPTPEEALKVTEWISSQCSCDVTVRVVPQNDFDRRLSGSLGLPGKGDRYVDCEWSKFVTGLREERSCRFP